MSGGGGGRSMMLICKSPERVHQERRNAELRKNFDRVDKDKDNWLSRPEWMEAMRLSGYDMTDRDLEDVFCRLDKDHNDKIGLDEFSGRETKVETAFRMLDGNGDGTITKAEYRKICPKLSETQLEALFARYDTSGDGRIAYAEFCAIMNARDDKKRVEDGNASNGSA